MATAWRNTTEKPPAALLAARLGTLELHDETDTHKAGSGPRFRGFTSAPVLTFHHLNSLQRCSHN